MEWNILKTTIILKQLNRHESIISKPHKIEEKFIIRSENIYIHTYDPNPNHSYTFSTAHITDDILRLTAKPFVTIGDLYN